LVLAMASLSVGFDPVLSAACFQVARKWAWAALAHSRRPPSC